MPVVSTWMGDNGPRRLRRGWRPDQGRQPAGCPAAGEGVKRLRGQAMTFDEVLAQVQALLQREQRVSYRGLKRRFALDDEYLEDLKEELIGAKRLASDEDGRFLVWTGGTTILSHPFPAPSPSTSPSSSQPLSARPQTLGSHREAGERRQLT